MPILSRKETHVLTAAPVEWDAYCSRRKPADMDALGSGLMDLASKIARCGAYISGRGLGLNHKDAVARCNRIYRNVRKALGYHAHLQRDIWF